MDALSAVQLIEEPSETKTEEEVLEAWQFLIDTGIVWQLQGVYGRIARSLINAKLCVLRKGNQYVTLPKGNQHV